MTKYIRLDAEKLNPPRCENVHGVEVEVFLSPYDVPEAVSAKYDQKKKRFVILFHYVVEDEPISSEPVDDTTNFQVGRNSQRLYRIEIDVEKLRASHVGLIVNIAEDRVKQAILRLEGKPSARHRLGNYGVVRKVVADQFANLFATTSAVSHEIRPIEPK